MNIDAVRSVLLSIELGSFSAAGTQLGVPPSTISRRVNDLEADLGRRLVVRTGRGVRPTEESGETLARLREALVAIEACYRPEDALTHLRVTAPSEMAISLLPGLLPDFVARFPDVFVEIHGSDRTVGLVEQQFDLAIRAGPLADSSYLAKPLWAAPLVVVAEPTLAGQIAGRADLKRLPTVTVARPLPQIAKLDPPVLARVDSFTAALPLVLSGQAWLACPAHLAQPWVAEGRLAVVEALEFSGARLHALYPRRHRAQAPLLGLIELVSAALERPLEA